ncbi:NADH dehydrogenase subunit I [Fulvimarina pelagi HTCC2506]|uniref:NADH dehydrogenase subunit I n=2 Tax=Fulvimarina pelagi TaxID=217511 RepID=Q0FZ94_9HYPH|nr:hypothetical protein [Fulvimarina pelagi]EAU40384.1 NADH dehydrogenase subunit I [Fulvimarina pelagi HTCC2506]BAT31421.1 NADH dehydrogenase subunit I [Fulvimarina pelagi]
MSMGLIGALIGLAIGIADYFVLGLIRDRFREQRPTERVGGGLIIEIVRISQLIFFPIAGWYVEAYVF